MIGLACVLSGWWVVAILCTVMIRVSKGPKSLEWGVRGMGWGFGIGALIAWGMS